MAKMKALYRACGNTYHEGEKTADTIDKLKQEYFPD